MVFWVVFYEVRFHSGMDRAGGPAPICFGPQEVQDGVADIVTVMWLLFQVTDRTCG